MGLWGDPKEWPLQEKHIKSDLISNIQIVAWTASVPCSCPADRLRQFYQEKTSEPVTKAGSYFGCFSQQGTYKHPVSFREQVINLLNIQFAAAIPYFCRCPCDNLGVLSCCRAASEAIQWTRALPSLIMAKRRVSHMESMRGCFIYWLHFLSSQYPADASTTVISCNLKCSVTRISPHIFRFFADRCASEVHRTYWSAHICGLCHMNRATPAPNWLFLYSVI